MLNLIIEEKLCREVGCRIRFIMNVGSYVKVLRNF